MGVRLGALLRALATDGGNGLRQWSQSGNSVLPLLERAVSWETEKLYGVEALGPFDEF